MTHIGTRPIETHRLLLRPFTVEDAGQMYKNWATDPRVTRWMRWKPHADAGVSRAILEDWVSHYGESDYYIWAITLKESGEVIGSIGILRGVEPEFADCWEPGYCIGHAFWGRGYTTEALRAVLDYFVRGTGEQHLLCCHAKGNPASGRVMEKAGFTYTRDGVYHKPDGTVVDAKYYEYNANPEDHERKTD